MIEREVGLEAVVHYACRDRNLLGMLSDLLGAAAAGSGTCSSSPAIRRRWGPIPMPPRSSTSTASGSPTWSSRLNRGLDPGGNPHRRSRRKFVIGVGVNPAAPDLERELKRFAWKVEAGAEYAITQPVFDLAQLDRFLARVESVPHPDRRGHLAADLAPERGVPGQRGARRQRAGCDRGPDAAWRARGGKEEALAEGVRIAREMLAAVADRVQGVQVSAPLGRVPVALEVLEVLEAERRLNRSRVGDILPSPEVRCRPSPEPESLCRTSAAPRPP